MKRVIPLAVLLMAVVLVLSAPMAEAKRHLTRGTMLLLLPHHQTRR